MSKEEAGDTKQHWYCAVPVLCAETATSCCCLVWSLKASSSHF